MGGRGGEQERERILFASLIQSNRNWFTVAHRQSPLEMHSVHISMVLYQMLEFQWNLMHSPLICIEWASVEFIRSTAITIPFMIIITIIIPRVLWEMEQMSVSFTFALASRQLIYYYTFSRTIELPSWMQHNEHSVTCILSCAHWCIKREKCMALICATNVRLFVYSRHIQSSPKFHSKKCKTIIFFIPVKVPRKYGKCAFIDPCVFQQHKNEYHFDCFFFTFLSLIWGGGKLHFSTVLSRSNWFSCKNY